MADDIIDIEDYEVKDTEIVETASEEDYQRTYDAQRDYDNPAGGFYKSITLDNKALAVILMVIALLIIIFIMTFD